MKEGYLQLKVFELEEKLKLSEEKTEALLRKIEEKEKHVSLLLLQENKIEENLKKSILEKEEINTLIKTHIDMINERDIVKYGTIKKHIIEDIKNTLKVMQQDFNDGLCSIEKSLTKQIINKTLLSDLFMAYSFQCNNIDKSGFNDFFDKERDKMRKFLHNNLTKMEFGGIEIITDFERYKEIKEKMGEE